MRARDVLSYSFSAIRLRKLRAALTTLGVIIGIAAIVALLSITQGLQATITKQLETGFATDTLIVTPRGGFGGGFGFGGGNGGISSGFQLLTNYTRVIDDIENETVQQSLALSMAVIQKACWIESGNRTINTILVGVNFTRYADIYSTFVAESGEIPSTPDNGAVIVGKRVSSPWNNATLFCSVDDSVGIIWQNASMNVLGFPVVVNETYTGHVVAVLKEIGGFGIGPSDTDVFIPITQAESFFGTDVCDMIIVKLRTDDKAIINMVSQAIEQAFNNQVSVTSATAVLSILSNVFSVIQLFLAGIAAISLLVAGIGIMNIMIVSLMERTREIGILKALGMRSRTVLLAFLSESVIIGLIGAVVGIVSGYALANIVAVVFRGGGGVGFGNPDGVATGMTITPLLTPTVVILALVFGVGVSAIFAIYPAWRASRLKPVEALRYE